MIKPLGYSSSSNNPPKAVCGICQTEESKYSCPNCSIFYCSMKCYNSSKHRSCSERFYKSNVTQRLKKGEQLGLNEDQIEEQKRLIQILHKFNIDNDDEHNNGDSNCKESSSDHRPEKWKYRLPKGVERNIRSLEEQLKSSDIHKLHYQLSEDDEDDDHPLSQEEEHELRQLINESSTEKLLSILTPEERREFENMIKDRNYIVDEE